MLTAVYFIIDFTNAQELNHLLLSPLIVGNPPARDEILQQIDRAVSLLSQSVGIRPAHEGLLRPQGPGSQPEIALEGGLVAAILQTAKGKKLMSRSINLLIPEQRLARCEDHLFLSYLPSKIISCFTLYLFHFLFLLSSSFCHFLYFF